MGNLVSLSLNTFDIQQQIRYMVEAALVWTVAALESLVNQALAEQIGNITLAKMAIEYPKNIVHQSTSKKYNSELILKLLILSDSENLTDTIHSSAKTLVHARHQIIHDKPYYFYVDEDGIDHSFFYKLRGKDEDRPYPNISDVPLYFQHADTLLEFINQYATFDDPIPRFQSLLDLTETSG